MDSTRSAQDILQGSHSSPRAGTWSTGAKPPESLPEREALGGRSAAGAVSTASLKECGEVGRWNSLFLLALAKKSVNNFCSKLKVKRGKRRNAGESEQDKIVIISFQLLKPKPEAFLSSFLSLIPPSNWPINLTDSSFQNICICSYCSNESLRAKAAASTSSPLLLPPLAPSCVLSHSSHQGLPEKPPAASQSTQHRTQGSLPWLQVEMLHEMTVSQPLLLLPTSIMPSSLLHCDRSDLLLTVF